MRQHQQRRIKEEKKKEEKLGSLRFLPVDCTMQEQENLSCLRQKLREKGEVGGEGGSILSGEVAGREGKQRARVSLQMERREQVDNSSPGAKK